jgi:hypothetical protein
MPRATKDSMSVPTPTVKRRKSWPKWARWYAVDEDGTMYVFATRPGIFLFSWIVLGGKCDQVRGPRLCSWRESLRKIAS